jgi:hypothetical protein
VVLGLALLLALALSLWRAPAVALVLWAVVVSLGRSAAGDHGRHGPQGTGRALASQNRAGVLEGVLGAAEAGVATTRNNE